MPISGAQFQQLHQALLSAYPNRASLAAMVSVGLNVSLEQFGTGSLDELVYSLIQWADGHGRVEELVHTARLSNPGNYNLKAVATSIGIAEQPVILQPEPPTESLDHDFDSEPNRQSPGPYPRHNEYPHTNQRTPEEFQTVLIEKLDEIVRQAAEQQRQSNEAIASFLEHFRADSTDIMNRMRQDALMQHERVQKELAESRYVWQNILDVLGQSSEHLSRQSDMLHERLMSHDPDALLITLKQTNDRSAETAEVTRAMQRELSVQTEMFKEIVQQNRSLSKIDATETTRQAAGGSADEPPDERRYTDIRFPKVCLLDSITKLTVAICVSPPEDRDGSVVETVMFPRVDANTQVVLDIIVNGSAFLVSPRCQQIIVPFESDSDTVIFEVTPLIEGQQALEIEIYHGARRIAYCVITTRIRDGF